MIRDLWKELCSYDNIFLAYKKARKHKTTKDYVLKFERDIKDNLLTLRSELLFHCYKPRPLVNFIIRDPKTRKISKSDFRDRVVYHALCNIIEPIFEKTFIYDSYANRKGKGSLKAVQRFDYFKIKVSKNNSLHCYILKADIKKYFENVDHNILLNVIKKKVKDKRVIWLIRIILNNSTIDKEDKGMPLGNLTSQFFANVYLNELDYFIKKELKAKYYIRYVDDFVILDNEKSILCNHKEKIDYFLKNKLNLQLHPQKSKIIKLGEQLSFLGFRIFYYHKLLKKSNLRKMRFKFYFLKEEFKEDKINYDNIYDFLEGWVAYSKQANAYKLRNKLGLVIERSFPNEISTKEINRIVKYCN